MGRLAARHRLPDSELGVGADSIIDPDGAGPQICFHVLPDAKVVKNRLHLDIHVSGSLSDPLTTRTRRVDAEARWLADLGATLTGALSEKCLDRYAVGMKDPEGNEFDISYASLASGGSQHVGGAVLPDGQGISGRATFDLAPSA